MELNSILMLTFTWLSFISLLLSSDIFSNNVSSVKFPSNKDLIIELYL